MQRIFDKAFPFIANNIKINRNIKSQPKACMSYLHHIAAYHIIILLFSILVF